jgi:hypothetical protein
MLSAGEVHVLFFGDSHTVGVGDPSGLGWVGRVVAASHAAGTPLVSHTTSAFAARRQEMSCAAGGAKRTCDLRTWRRRS